MFRRSGRITEPERITIQAIQKGHPDLQEHSNGFLVEAYRKYKRRHLDEIAIEAARNSSLKVIHAGTQVIEVGSRSKTEQQD